jgi:hypothetical protein
MRTRAARWYPLLLGGGALEALVYEGHRGMPRFVAGQADEAWSEVAAELIEVHDLDANRVLAHTRLTAVGEASGAKVAQVTSVVFTCREGKLTEGRTSASEGEALAYASD